MAVLIDEEIIKKYRGSVKERLTDPGVNYYTKITSDSAKMQFERFLGAFCAVKAETGDNATSSYYSSSYILKNSGQRGGINFDLNFNSSDRLFLDDLIKTYIRFAEYKLDSEDITTKYLTNILLKSSKVIKGVAGGSGNLYNNLGNNNCGNVKPYVQINSKIENKNNLIENINANLLDDKIIGNSKLKKALDIGLKELLMYDISKKYNFISEMDGCFSQTYLFHGRPGTGKTSTIMQMVAKYKKIAEENGKPFNLRELRGFKSEYFSKSLNNLRDIFNEVSEGNACYVLLAEDIDTIFFNRNSFDENNAILGEILNLLEGASHPNLYNYLFISTTNRVDCIDQALLDRIRQCDIEVNGPETVDEVKHIFLSKLDWGIKRGIIQVKDWDRIAKCAFEKDLVGRNIRNVLKQVYQNSKNYSGNVVCKNIDEAVKGWEVITDGILIDQIEYESKKINIGKNENKELKMNLKMSAN